MLLNVHGFVFISLWIFMEMVMISLWIFNMDGFTDIRLQVL